MDAEDTKEKFLKLLNTNDEWKHPIVIQLKPLDAADPSEAPSDVRIVNTEDGFKVEFNIVLGDDPHEAHFPQQLIRALLLEYAYRNQSNVIRPARLTPNRRPGLSMELPALPLIPIPKRAPAFSAAS